MDLDGEDFFPSFIFIVTLDITTITAPRNNNNTLSETWMGKRCFPINLLLS